MSGMPFLKLIKNFRDEKVDVIREKQLAEAKRNYEAEIEDINEQWKNGGVPETVKRASWVLAELAKGNAVCSTTTCADTQFLPMETRMYHDARRNCFISVFEDILSRDQSRRIHKFVDRYCNNTRFEVKRSVREDETGHFVFVEPFDANQQFLPNGKKVVLAPSENWDDLWEEELRSTSSDSVLSFRLNCWFLEFE